MVDIVGKRPRASHLGLGPPLSAIPIYAISIFATRPYTLSRDAFHILVALADRDRHGYSIMQEVEERTKGDVRLSPSSLYSAIRRLLEEGLIEELRERPDPEHDDERRRYYRLTKTGRRMAGEEARRLERLLADARATGLIPKRR